jgi:hypothetical protein
MNFCWRVMSRGFLIGACISVLSVAARATDEATEPSHIRTASSTPPSSNITIVSPAEVSATPQMWFYEQSLARYNDPKYAVRAAAEYKANQRRARMTATQWYGYSNSRPAMGMDPVDGPTQAQWIGNGYQPTSWIAPSVSIWAIPGVANGY